jgi:signal transduction histidine kinase
MGKGIQIDIFIILVFLLFINNSSYGQEDRIDSLKIAINESNSDTSIIKSCINLSWEYMYINADSVLFYIQKSLNLIEGKKLPYYQANVYKTLASLYIIKAEYDSAIVCFEKALIFTEKIEDQKRRKTAILKLGIFGNIGLAYYYQGKYDKSIENHLKCLKLSKKINYGKGISISCTNIGLAYNYTGEYQKSIQYHQRALEVGRELNDYGAIMLSLNNMGVVYLAIPNYDSAYYYIKKCTSYNEEKNIKWELIYNYANLSRIYNYRKKYDSALYYATSSLKLAKELELPVGTALACNVTGEVYLETKYYNKALYFFKKSLQLSIKNNIKHSMKDCYDNLSLTYRIMGDYKQSYNNAVLASTLNDSLLSKESSARIAGLESKYKIEQQEEEISLLQKQSEIQKEKRRIRKLVFISVIVILSLIVLLLILAYRSFRQKQVALKETLERETKRKIIKTTIQTADNERQGFAVELHEELGSLLAALRFYINELGSESLRGEEREELLSNTNRILDNSIAKVRAMSNLLMPANLKSMGLSSALQSYCDKVTAYGKLNVLIDFVSLSNKYSNNLEITLYRILTDMINNTIKHTKAENIEILLSEENTVLSVMYKVDGVGFDYQNLPKSDKRRIGITNITNRIESIGGNWIIHRDKEKKFLAEITVNVNY